MATWEDYEHLAVSDLAARMGDAWRTREGSDGGIDVDSPGCAAQVKAQLVPVGRPDLQALVGAAATRTCAFYSLGGYTGPAFEYAAQVAMALFEFKVTGEVIPVNDFARELGLTDAAGRSAIAAYREATRMSQMGPDGEHQCPVCGRVHWTHDASSEVECDGYSLWVCDQPDCKTRANALLDTFCAVMNDVEVQEPRLRDRRLAVDMMMACNGLLYELDLEDEYEMFDLSKQVTEADIARVNRLHPRLLQLKKTSSRGR